MKKIELSFLPARDRRALHTYLQEALGLPEYYGKNLDALYDCLTEIGEDTAICAAFAPYRKRGYEDSVRRVLRDAEAANPHLCVFITYPARIGEYE